ncbi:allantoinase PuuE [Colwellia echini]|uniref:Allantoinase PuuE n=1 Tax=Colwellia echini TaxID=1982103 RepID=A0ABY3MZJ3_9GAMM|nr:allantoinase PuuE [Colwellia echini]TYK66650.1 allantoinase PuuE [Colwellia echini]
MSESTNSHDSSNSYDDYPRDLLGYGAKPPHANWPNKARIAVQVVMNYEEGGENCVLHGDDAAETFLSEIVSAPHVEDRHISMESIYEYGSRVGVWRLLRLFEKYNLPVTVFAVAMALKRNPAVAKALVAAGHEICSHGLRWINYQNIDIDTERQHMQEAMAIIEEVSGVKPQGWYTGRTSPNTASLVAENGSFLYDADDYSDDLPFWRQVGEKQQLIVPYTLDVNDMRFAAVQGFNAGDQFFNYLKDSFDALYEEGDPQGENRPKMMSIGLHCRLVGRPGRIKALERFFQYVQSFEGVWFARRIDIAKHWQQEHPQK